ANYPQHWRARLLERGNLRRLPGAAESSHQSLPSFPPAEICDPSHSRAGVRIYALTGGLSLHVGKKITPAD
ncbi:hypothetical protein, partial [Nocardia puris]|uniref:hypothetical protein n=1 Tax=Nocardia puris TaxID=208602 RepID=UPI001E2DA616